VGWSIKRSTEKTTENEEEYSDRHRHAHRKVEHDGIRHWSIFTKINFTSYNALNPFFACCFLAGRDARPTVIFCLLLPSWARVPAYGAYVESTLCPPRPVG